MRTDQRSAGQHHRHPPCLRRGIHDTVGDQALWGKHPPGWLLRLSPSVDAVAKILNHSCVSCPNPRRGFWGRFLGFSTCLSCAYTPEAPLDLMGSRWWVEGRQHHTGVTMMDSKLTFGEHRRDAPMKSPASSPCGGR